MSLGLAAYRALARKGESASDLVREDRPAGSLIWIHAGEPGNLVAVQDLAMRLVQGPEAVNVLITVPQSAIPSTGLRHAPSDSHIRQMPYPGDHPGAAAEFCAHWRPDVGLWVWGALKPNLILEASNHDCALYLIDTDTDGLDRRQNRWLPDLTRQVLSRFRGVLTRSKDGFRRLTQLGVAPHRIEVTPPLRAGGRALPCDERELADLSAAMGGRPAWFAASILPNELSTVLTAHRQALRLSHRLLLIVQPANAQDSSMIAARATEAGLQVCHWDEGAFPEDTTQVLIAEGRADHGLFFRVAPVSFLGSTLTAGDHACDPLDAAALGTAILYGPKVRHFMPSYSRLASAGAARIVNDADALGAAVSNLIAPEHAAAMAHAGWDVISQGAGLTDKVLDLVQQTLDEQVVAR